MVDVASIRALENKLLLYSDHRGDPSPECEVWCDDLCKQTFGITSAETEFQWPIDFDVMEKEGRPECWDFYRAYHAHEARFDTSELDAPGRVELLTKLGLDFTDDNGQPLRCLARFFRAAEAAAKRMNGFSTSLPTLEQISVSSFGDAMAADAQAFLAKKRRS